MTSSRAQQLASTVFMVRPAQFYSNPETAVSNSFQQPSSRSQTELLQRAQTEFDAAVVGLSDAGVKVLTLPAIESADTPDAVFPNNWFSTHADGRVVLYPMATPKRRCERRWPELQALCRAQGFAVTDCVDLSAFEHAGQYLEGTGSMVLDGAHSRVYAALSPRTHAAVLARVAQQLGMEVVSFSAMDPAGLPVYHTNVMLALAPQLAVVAPELIVDSDRARVVAALQDGRELLTLTRAQITAFAANILFLHNAQAEPVVAISQTAIRALSAAQLALLERHALLVACEVSTIEHVGGGGIRCMLAEIFLPRADA
jgi:hypothetical protein